MNFEKQQHKALFPATQSSSNVRGLFQYMKASVLAVRDVSLGSPVPGPLVPGESKAGDEGTEHGPQETHG